MTLGEAGGDDAPAVVEVPGDVAAGIPEAEVAAVVDVAAGTVEPCA